MEKLARSQYLKSKDPKDCALLYIALNRIKVLVGLFKISRDEKDKRLYEFLSRNFQVFQSVSFLFDYWTKSVMWLCLSYAWLDPIIIILQLFIFYILQEISNASSGTSYELRDSS